MNQRGVGGSQKGPGSPLGSNAVAGLIGLGVVALIVLFVVFNSVTTIDAGTRGVVKTFGEVTSVFDEGLHFRMPMITSVTLVDIKTQRYSADSSAASRDLQTVRTQIILNYRPDSESASLQTLIREIGTNYESVIIEPAVQESVKAATALFTAEELITRRSEVAAGIRDVLAERLRSRGIVVEEVSITEFEFTEEFSAAIERKQVAEQDALRAERELERARTEAQQQVARAEAAAEARLQIAQAEAEALRLQREVISSELLQLRFIEKWNGVLPRFASGESGIVPLINIPESELADNDTALAVPTPTSLIGDLDAQDTEANVATPTPTATPAAEE